MADARVQIGLSTDYLEGTSVNTPAGENLFREGVVLSDPDVANARARIVSGVPGASDFGVVVRTAGTSSVSVTNFPATQAVSGTVAATQSGTWSVGRTWVLSGATDTVNIGNFPATQAVSGTVTANLGTLNGAATAANQTTGNTSLSSIDGKLPDESGAWGYNAGVAGTLAVAANKRILAITATAPTLGAASLTINGGQTVTIPSGSTITISPRGNLVAPSIVFTGTSAYFVEFVE